jgi:hypothetical protein
VAFEKMLVKPDEHLGIAGITALGFGATLFVGATALSWHRLSRRWLWSHLLLITAVRLELLLMHPPAPALTLIWVAACPFLVANIQDRTRPGARVGRLNVAPPHSRVAK